MSTRTDVNAIEYAADDPADMLTHNARRPATVDGTMKPDRSKGVRSGVQPAALSIGAILRERREAMGVTLAEVEVATRIRQKYLAALESDEWDLLPGEVVGRGFLRNYSTYLGLDPNEMIERRRAIADESLAAVLADTSAGSTLPPERPVDYRPKDVALHDEEDELEPPRRINLAPVAAVLAVVALVAALWWAATQFGGAIVDAFTGVQQQIAAWQEERIAQPAPTATQMTPPALPTNLIAPQPVVENNPAESSGATNPDAQPQSSVPSTAPVGGADAASAAAAQAGQQDATQPPAAPSSESASGAVNLLALLPTPTPAPTAPTAAPARVITAANLRQGPSTEFPIVGGAVEGQEILLVGRNADGSWYRLDNGAWIFAQLVENAPADLPVVEAPAAP
ncbi:helix-turn-helix domain-containing protein [Caldilinea sp.]|jgi:cytoskeletal protein RodZ|uniref:helix-turn-helix domain-containing protein n=1 Tax=Caldilinea sp. TaxID=2293560 RepID=UPI00260D4372|nr:helix-turn-helix domain-containing protein [uncultured Caldilinea sp.]